MRRDIRHGMFFCCNFDCKFVINELVQVIFLFLFLGEDKVRQLVDFDIQLNWVQLQH